MSEKIKSALKFNLKERLPYKNIIGSLSFFLIIINLSGCASSSNFRKSDLVTHFNDKIISVSEDRTSIKIFQIDTEGIPQEKSNDRITVKDGSIENISILDDGSLAVITGTGGIFIFPYRKNSFNSNGFLNITYGKNKNQLADGRIRDVYLYEYNNIKKLFITYNSPHGSGVTECVLTNDWNPEFFKTYSKLNSNLKSNYVCQVMSDTKGNIWFRYSESEGEGLSRMDPSGNWSHFNRENSELGDSSVTLMAAEETGSGLPGNNIWFASDAGLSRLEYSGEKETWKLYGEKQSYSNKFLKLLGIESYFSDAILGIIDIKVIPGSILITTKYAVFNFTGDNINRFIPETVKDLDNSRISHIFCRNGFVFTFIKLPQNNDTLIRSVSVLDLGKREWHHLKYWEIKRDYPDNIQFIPAGRDTELAILYYKTGEIKFAVFDYNTFELKEQQVKQ